MLISINALHCFGDGTKFKFAGQPIGGEGGR